MSEMHLSKQLTSFLEVVSVYYSLRVIIHIWSEVDLFVCALVKNLFNLFVLFLVFAFKISHKQLPWQDSALVDRRVVFDLFFGDLLVLRGDRWIEHVSVDVLIFCPEL